MAFWTVVGTGIEGDLKGKSFGLTLDTDDAKQAQWRAYAASLDLQNLAFEEVIEAAWALIGPSCERLSIKT